MLVNPPSALRLLSAGAVLFVMLTASCSRVEEGPYYSATGMAFIEPGASFSEGRLAAIQKAEKAARDQILQHVRDRRFPNGVSLEEAIVTDPFIQAKVYDTIRTSKITDQTVAEDGIVTVTVQLDLKPVLQILENPEYGGRSETGAAAAGKP